ncbi:hypothetical protein QTN25_007052 [Entamoeba marina]
MSKLQTVYLMNVALYFTTKRIIFQFVQISKNCYDAVKGLHRAPNISIFTLPTQLRMFPKLQHVSGDLLSFQNLVSLKQLQRISSFENENKNALTPIESIHKAFIGRVKQINITYPFPDLIKFKKLEEIRISFDREYLCKKKSGNKVFLIDVNDINEKIRYLRMLKRVVLYDISKDMFKKNIKVFGDIKPTIQLFIHYNNVIDDYLLDELPDNVHIITSAITTLNPKIVCLTNNQTLPINISWDPRLNSTTSLKQLEKAYLPSTISFNFDSNKQLQRKGIDLSTFRNVKIKNLIIQSDCFTISSTCDNLPIEKLTIERSCTSIYLGKTRVKYLVVYSADYISVNSSLETIEFKSGMLTTIKSEKEKKELTIIVNLNKMLTINNITTINFSGHGFVTPVNIDSTTIHSDSVCFAKHVDDNSFLNLQTLTFKNCKCNTQLDFKTFICPRLLHLSFTNCKFQKIYFPNNLQTLVYDNTTAKLYDVQNLPIKLQSMFDENV